MRLILLAIASISASCHLVRLGGGVTKCGPQTKLALSDAEDAAGTPQYTEVAGLVDGECISKGVETITHVKFCGPGTLTLSRMSCGRHDYKSHTVEHPGSEYTTQCEVIAAEGTVIDGYIGSAIVTCGGTR